MITKRILWALITLLVIASVPTLLFAQAGAKKLPPFRIQSDIMALDLNSTPQQLVFDKNVKFTSTLYDTTITCGHLEANAKSLEKVSSVEATKKVVMTMTIETKSTQDANAKTKSRVDGTGESITYSLVDTNPVVRMVKVGNVLPRLTITDLTTKEVTEITGDEILYDMAKNKLTVHQVDMGNEGNGQ